MKQKFQALSGWSIKKFVAIQCVTTLVVVGAIWLGSWVGRSEVVGTQRSGCVRSVNSTIDLKLTNADMDALADVIGRVGDLSVADRRILDAISDRADERIEDLNTRLPPVLDCKAAFPDPGPFAVPDGAQEMTPPPITQPQVIQLPPER